MLVGSKLGCARLWVFLQAYHMHMVAWEVQHKPGWALSCGSPFRGQVAGGLSCAFALLGSAHGWG